MHERAAAAGGTLAIASDAAAGTQVTIRLPRRRTPSMAGPTVAANQGVG
jgi:signal transduction histidine kinase